MGQGCALWVNRMTGQGSKNLRKRVAEDAPGRWVFAAIFCGQEWREKKKSAAIAQLKGPRRFFGTKTINFDVPLAQFN